jgi:hypothetical protein
MQIPTRRSTSGSNKELNDVTEEFSGRDNMSFFRAAFSKLGSKSTGTGQIFIGFVGSRDLPGVALRRAQSILRWDIRPSLWSHTFILTSDSLSASASNPVIYHVPFDTRSADFPAPEKNAVTKSRLEIFADPKRDANVALVSVSLPSDDVAKVAKRCEDPNLDRIRYNFWDTLGVWQSYFWSFGLRTNPLRDGCPIPSASFIEYCFEALALDITPGASERNSAPEHLWNAAKFWYQAYATKNHAVTGRYALRDMGCALMSADERQLERAKTRRKSRH